jgi:anthranilate/para-aminobenzoate synthase component I
MEGARRHDELVQSRGPSSSQSAPNSDASDELQFSGDENTDAAAGVEAEQPAPVPDETTVRVAAVAVDRIAERAVEQASPLPRVAIVIEPELPALDWLRETLAPAFSRIHAFQRSEQGVERLRQYLARGDVPAVVVSDRALADPASGALDALALLERVRSLSPRAFTALVVDPDSTRPAPRGVDVRLVRPRDSDLVGGLSRATRREQAARRLQDDLLHGAADDA